MNWIEERCVELVERDGWIRCTKLIRLRAVGTTLFIELVKRDLDSDEETVKDLAHLPRETYFVSEPYFGEMYVAYENGKLIAASWSWSGLLRKLKARGYYVGRSTYLSASEIAIPYVKKTVSAGLTDKGDVVDPFGVLDKADYGAEPLKASYEWVKSIYSGRNAVYAWFNIIAAVAHVATSPLKTSRYLRNEYLDYVVYNVGVGSYDMGFILEQLLGGFYAFDAYYTVVYGLPYFADLGRKYMAARLLDLNRLPLVLTGQTRQTLKYYKYVLESAGGKYITLDRRGEKRIPNLRGLIIFADDLHNIPAPRRLVLRWDLAHTHMSPAKLPPIKPIYGFAARLWRKHRDRLTANKLPYLVEAVARTIAQEIRDEAEEVATFTERAIDEAKRVLSAK